MSYLVFARKFRPQIFEDVVGQEHITTTLKNAIDRNRIAQSFLFSGSRGVGKTSTARILAKTLNCEKIQSQNPCNKCSSCEEISRGSSLDVLEIDGASNRGIDEIRTLRENVKFKPAHGRFKIYIIDEVHMLTGEAFNALLKTLEEPPEHVKFIFATTEPHKVPLTILSRCQRFHFKRLLTSEIHAKLKEIAKKEKIKINEKTLFLIAKSAEGSLRDGEGLLDQLASFSEGEIKEEDVLFSLGLTASELFLRMLNAISERRSNEILKLVLTLSETGKDLEQFMRGLTERFRDILVLSLGDGSAELVEQDPETLSELNDFVKKFNQSELFLILSLLQQTLRDIRWSRTPKFLTELCLLKIANRTDLKSVSELISEVKKSPSRIVSSTQPSAQKLFSNPLPDKKKDPEPAPKPNLKPAMDLTLVDIERIWPDLLTQVKAKRMSIGMFLSESEPVEVEGNRVIFGFPPEFKFHKETIDQQNNKIFVRDILSSILGASVEIAFAITEADQMTEKTISAPNSGVDSNVIVSALEIFDGSKVIRKT